MNQIDFTSKVKKLTQNKLLKRGIPFLILVIGGSFGLQQFTSLRYKFATNKAVSKKELEDEGITMKEDAEITLEVEFDKIKTIDIENWENKRAPRPWEENWNEIKEVT